MATELIPKFYKRDLANREAGEDLYLMLLTSLHVPNMNTQQFVSDVSENEAIDTTGAYPPGGVQITGLTGQFNSLNAYLDGSDVEIGPGAIITYRYGVVYRLAGTPGASHIIRHIDFKVDQVVINGLSVIRWNQLGIMLYK